MPPPDRFFQTEPEAAGGAGRGAGKAPPLPPLEAALLVVTALNLCFLPWALGGMHVWSQLASAALALIGFGLAALPRTGARLLRLPVFWGGLAMLGYIVVQGLNPAWRFASNATVWWLDPISHIPWLPSGVDGPFEQSNAWRALMIYGSLWLVVCSVWAGFLRRQSYRTLFTVLVVNAFLLASLGVLQQLLAAKRIFWFYQTDSGSFIASFIYRNHAGPYFNLMVALAVGLAWWDYRRSRRGLENPGPAGLFTLAAVLVGIMVMFSYSRMSIVMLLAFIGLTGFALVVRLLNRGDSERGRSEFLPLAVIFAGFLGVCAVTLGADKVWERFAGLVAEPVASTRDRTLARRAATEMLEDHWILGWGAGSFRYGFPIYAQKYPEIYKTESGIQRYWEHAHDDLIEFPLEFGVVGLLPFIFILGHCGWQLGRRRFWRNPLALSIVLGCALVLVHGWVDFVFQNPAVLLSWGVLLVGAVRWSELDQPLGRRAP